MLHLLKLGIISASVLSQTTSDTTSEEPNSSVSVSASVSDTTNTTSDLAAKTSQEHSELSEFPTNAINGNSEESKTGGSTSTPTGEPESSDLKHHRYEDQIVEALERYPKCTDAQRRGYDSAFVCCSVRDGSWFDPNTWNCNRVPSADDAVFVRHHVSYSPDPSQPLSKVRALHVIETIEPQFSQSKGRLVSAEYKLCASEDRYASLLDLPQPKDCHSKPEEHPVSVIRVIPPERRTLSEYLTTLIRSQKKKRKNLRRLISSEESSTFAGQVPSWLVPMSLEAVHFPLHQSEVVVEQNAELLLLGQTVLESPVDIRINGKLMTGQAFTDDGHEHPSLIIGASIYAMGEVNPITVEFRRFPNLEPELREGENRHCEWNGRLAYPPDWPDSNKSWVSVIGHHELSAMSPDFSLSFSQLYLPERASSYTDGLWRHLQVENDRLTGVHTSLKVADGPRTIFLSVDRIDPRCGAGRVEALHEFVAPEFKFEHGEIIIMPHSNSQPLRIGNSKENHQVSDQVVLTAASIKVLTDVGTRDPLENTRNSMSRFDLPWTRWPGYDRDIILLRCSDKCFLWGQELANKGPTGLMSALALSGQDMPPTYLELALHPIS